VKVLRDAPSTATWDADGGVGVLVGQRAMTACIEKAKQAGIGMIVLRNGRHFGAAGYYAHMAAREDLIGMAMCNTGPIGAAAGGIERVYGTNPIAMGAPVEGQPPFLLDMATTVVAGGKLEIAMRQGKGVPVGWAMAEDGSDTEDAEILRKKGAILPLGSRLETSSYKGYGLGLMVDILTGVLSGAGNGMLMERNHHAQWFAAWRIDAFRDLGEFKAEMRSWLDGIRATKPERGVERVYVAGDLEHLCRADREANGVPLDAETIEQLTALGEEVGRPFGRPLAAR
jgi:LDH2 family malate/lactate/ureidoglycolate dehydrogenase